MHEALVRLAKMDSILALADLVGHHQARVALRLQIPVVIEARCRAGRIAVPADTRKGHKLVDLAFERQAEGRPVKYGASLEDVAAVDVDIVRIRIPLRPLRRVDDVAPDALA